MAASVPNATSSTTTEAIAPKVDSGIPPIPPTVPTGVAYLCNTDANRSVMCWYDNLSASQDGVTLPQATDPVGPADSDVTWEGQYVSGIIMSSSTPTDFYSKINADAATAAFQSQVGTAELLLNALPGQPEETRYFADFNCFKDNLRVLYVDAQFGNVYSVYYCLFANGFHGVA